MHSIYHYGPNNLISFHLKTKEISPKFAINSEIFKYSRDTCNEYHNFLNYNKFISERTTKEQLESTVKNDISREKDVEKNIREGY